jgi:ATP-binding protein involved in chromosome partitioning
VSQGFPYQEYQALKKLEQIKRVVLVGSGKGGVGKSFVACGLSLSLRSGGYSTGILDVDIHGASLPNYLGVKPPVRSGKDGMEPKRSGGVKVMSVALFTGQNPVPMRGKEKQSLITQLVALTNWGELDYLCVDLPPSMGDELLSAFRLFAGKSRLVLVTTPSRAAVSVVARLRRLADAEHVPVEGIVLNMAYSTVGGRKTYPFGRADRKSLESELDSKVIAEIPLEPRVSSQGLRAILRTENNVTRAFEALADRIAG